ncbi:MAG: D-alanyl-D-alanine endopeptidase [Gammaproteobacteria bacterium]|nr:D-alanyl-D-alanine endopeptidase [Gammaproteobacteria bacterium]
MAKFSQVGILGMLLGLGCALSASQVLAVDSQAQKLAVVNVKPTPILDQDELFRKILESQKLSLKSRSAVVFDLRDGEVLFERDAEHVRPIASLTKLMTAMVTLDANLPMDEVIEVADEDRDTLRHSRSKLRVGAKLTREDMLLIALAASENRAAAALARSYPGGTKAFVKAMNYKAVELGMLNTRYVDPTGLHDQNVSTASDLVKLVMTANEYPLIREMSTNGTDAVTDLRRGSLVKFRNTNILVRDKQWDVNVSKTGYISSAGYCLIMHTNIADRPLAVVLLNAPHKNSKFGDANRIKKWLLKTESKLQKLDHLASS